MKLVRSWVGLAAVALCAPLGSAWTITSDNTTQPAKALGEHQDYVKVWTVAGTSVVDAIQFAAAGPVFIDYDANLDAGVAKVVLSGDSTALLDEIEVVEKNGALVVHFPDNKDFRGAGYLLTTVVVSARASLAAISSSGSSSVYVGEEVFATTDRAAKISISGDANVYVGAPKTDFLLKSLDAKVSGSGAIQFHAASLALSQTLSTKISGDATLAVVAKKIDVKDTIESKISGHGDVYIQADTVQTSKIDSKISGDGDITISTNGKCVSQDIAISGTGTVSTGSVLCENTNLKMSGIGSVLVQTSGTFLVPRSIMGKVQYVGAAPQHITDGTKARPPQPKHRGWGWNWGYDDDEDEFDSSSHLPKSVTAASQNTYKTYELRDVPTREPKHVKLTINHMSFLGWDINIDGTSLAAQVHEEHGFVGVAALAVLSVAAVAAVGVAIHKAVMQRRRRREYQPLIQVVTK